MPALALAFGAAVGLVLGLVGGGGSLLAVPLLALLGLAPAEARAGSLLVVALAALGGLVPHLRARSVDARAALLVGGAGAPASLAGALVARLLPDAAQTTLFALVAGVAGALLLRPAPGEARAERADPRRALLAGAGAGLLTGLVGVGGGFVLVPALTLGAGLPARRAVGTSLVVIVVNSLAGLAGAWSPAALDPRLGLFAGAAVLGAVVGGLLAGRVPQPALRRGLGGALLLLALLLLASVAARACGRASGW